MDISTISAAAAGLKFAKDTVSGLLDAKIDIDTRTKVTEVLTKLGDAQDTLFGLRENLFELQTENAKLKQQIADADDWRKRIAPYAVTQTTGGAVVCRNAGGDGVPEHFACPVCANKREIQILQDKRSFTASSTAPAAKQSIRSSHTAGSGSPDVAVAAGLRARLDRGLRLVLVQSDDTAVATLGSR